MRVLHILDHSWPHFTGYAFRTGAIVAEQRRVGIETYLLTSENQRGGDQRRESANGLDFYRTPPSGAMPQSFGPLRQLAVIRSLRKRLREVIAECNPDVLHAHSPCLIGVAALGLKVPLVYEVRAFWEDAAVEHGTTRRNSIRYRLSRALESFVLRRAQAVVTICDGLRGDILARGIPAKKVSRVPNAVDLDRLSWIESRDPERCAELALGDSLVLGFVGSFYGYEGLDLAIEALAVLAAADKDVTLVLVGGGPENERLRALANKLGVASRCRFVGQVPHGQVRSYYSTFDACLFPRKRSRLTDLVTPLKPLEAMAQGVPVLVSDVGGHRELVRHGETGLMFAPDDVSAIVEAVDELSRHRDRLGDMRRRAHEFVTTARTWSAVARVYPDLYARVAAGGK